MSLKTPLYDQHVAAEAKIVDFHGWLLPIHYGSQLEEHHVVRREAGVFDVSHMTIVDFFGKDTEAFLRYLLANDVAKLINGKALYSAMLNDQAGILDDLIVYKVAADQFRIIFNAATRDKDLAWVTAQKQAFDVTLHVHDDLVNLAIQGPEARAKVAEALPDLKDQIAALKPFHFFQHQAWQLSRTGYTGEDGLEVILPVNEAAEFWHQLLRVGVKPCGLGARDTLRLEAGLNLYGSDMDENVTPLESNIAWTLAFEPLDRNFIGRQALEVQKAKNDYQHLVGLLLLDRGVLRSEQKIFQQDHEIGVVVSGTFSPTLEQGIAFARINPSNDDYCEVEIRGKRLSAKIVKLPFVRHGKVLVSQQEASKV